MKHRIQTGRNQAMIKYLIVVEETPSGFSAYAPDLDGCVAAGHSRDDVEKNMREAMAFHLDGLHRSATPIPTPHTYPSFVDILED
jgi:predicted RNase H-like HicB family nuclease